MPENFKLLKMVYVLVKKGTEELMEATNAHGDEIPDSFVCLTDRENLNEYQADLMNEWGFETEVREKAWSESPLGAMSHQPATTVNPYKTLDSTVAVALSRYWEAYGVQCNIENKNAWYEISPKGQIQNPFWRNICDAFIAGRTSRE